MKSFILGLAKTPPPQVPTDPPSPTYERPTFKRCVYWFIQDVLEMGDTIPYYNEAHSFKDIRNFKVWLHLKLKLSLKRIDGWIAKPQHKPLLDLLLDCLTIYNRSGAHIGSQRAFVAFKAEIEQAVKSKETDGGGTPLQLVTITNKVEKVNLRDAYPNEGK